MKLRQLFENIYEETPDDFDNSLKTIGVCYGRWNPPHRGHKEVWKAASTNPIWYVGTNKSTSGPKDPLPYDVKLQCMQAVWPKVAGHVIPEQSLMTLASRIYSEHGSNVYLKVYTDEEWLIKALQKYNGVDSEHGMYKFSQIDWVKTERLASATNLRAAVRNGDRESFYKDMGIKPSVTLNVNNKELPVFDVVAHFLNKYPEKSKKEVATAECAGVGIITKQNSTADVNAGTPKKNLDAFNLEESHMAELSAEIGEYLDGPLSGFKAHKVDADALGNYCIKLAHVLGRKHGMTRQQMQHFVNEYVDNALAGQEELHEAREGKQKKSAEYAHKGVMRMRDVGGYDRTYHLNRIMMAAAMSDGTDVAVPMDSASWIEKYNTAYPYTEQEWKKLKSAMKTVPTDSKVISKFEKSMELPSTNTTSAVAKPKRNKYGV